MQGKITFNDILYLLRKYIGWIVAFTLIGAVAAMGYSTLFLKEKYTATCQLYVNNLSSDSSTGNINNADLAAAIRMVNTNIAILKSNVMLKAINEQLDRKIGTGAISNSLSFTAEEEASIIKISSTTDNPALSAEICNLLTELAPEILYDIQGAGSAKRIDIATEPQSPSSPNIPSNTLMGGILGFIISFGILIVRFMFDNTVKGEEDIRQMFDIPVLGEIPSFGKNTKRRKR